MATEIMSVIDWLDGQYSVTYSTGTERFYKAKELPGTVREYIKENAHRKEKLPWIDPAPIRYRREHI